MPRPCLLSQDATVYKYLNPSDYTKDVDGNDVTAYLNGTTGTYNAMVEFGKNGKKIWYKIVPDEGDDSSATVYIADKQVDSDFADWAFHNSSGVSVDHFYMHIYGGCVVDSTLRSISGKAPSQNTTMANEIAYAQANNQNSKKEWYIDVEADTILITLLLMLLGKSTDTQTTYGQGNCKGYVGASDYGLINSGTMDTKGMFWGDTTGNKVGVKVFGIENWWGNQWRRVAGDVMLNGVTRMVKLTWGTEDGTTVTGYNTDSTGYINLGAVGGSGTRGGYISKVKYDKNGLYAHTASGSSTTKYCDGLWWNVGLASACAIVGGRSSSGALCGAFACSLSNAASVVDWSIAAALSCKPLA
jgi:hypothetical protein